MEVERGEKETEDKRREKEEDEIVEGREGRQRKSEGGWNE